MTIIEAESRSHERAPLAPFCEEAGLDPLLAHTLATIGAPFSHRLFHAATPDFRAYDEDGFAPCRGARAFPAFSITGGACALDCKHCRATILKPMIPAGPPKAFEQMVEARIAAGLSGFLLSGGSNRRNEVAFEPYMPAIKNLKRRHPSLSVLVHTGLVDERRATLLKDAGVDVAMLDIIGADETIREVYHLDRPVAAFAASLRHLHAAGLDTVPHIVAGLHFGQLLGEQAALDIIAATPTRAAIIVVLMHAFADAAFTPVNPHEIGTFFGVARQKLGHRQLFLGCARPHGRSRQSLDAYAALAGFDGIAHPSAIAGSIIDSLGRPRAQAHACCGLKCRVA